MSAVASRTVRARVVGALLLIMGAVLTLSVALVPDAATVSAAPPAAPVGTVGTSTVQLQSTATWQNSTVSALSARGDHSCVLEDGVVYCWGRGYTLYTSILGNGSSVDQSVPVKVSATDGFANNGTVSAIATSFRHSCAIEGGIVYCWGDDLGGSLGRGLSQQQGGLGGDRGTPGRVLPGDGFSNNGTVSAVAVGGDDNTGYTCAIEGTVAGGDARLYCWGAYYLPELGFGDSNSPATQLSQSTQLPVQVVPAGGFANNGTVSAIATGAAHTCAIEGTATGGDARLYCWGSGANGRLGTGNTTSSNLAIPVVAAGGFANNGTVSAVSAGHQHTCALEGTAAGNDSTLYCWGNGTDGRLGTGNTTSSNTASRVSTSGLFFNNGTVSAVSAGDQHTCAIQGGRLFCWGGNGYRQLGDNTNVAKSSAQLVRANAGFANAGNVTAVSTARGTTSNRGRRTCAVEGTGVAYCWGSEQYGQLGNGRTDAEQAMPVKVLLVAPPSAPAAPTNLSVTAGFGQLSVSFTAPAGPVNNYEYSTNNGSTWTARNPVSTSSPLVITGLNNGTQYSVRIRAVNDGGTGTQSSTVTGTPSALWSNGSASTVAGGGSHSCAISGGVLFCWGANGAGQLGDGTTTDSTTAKRVTPANGFLNTGDVSTLALGGEHSCAIESGIVYCWGFNDFGQLGDGTTTGRTSPVKVTPANGFANNGTVSAVALGAQHTCAIEGSGASAVVYCWGNASNGQLGEGSSSGTQSSPVPVSPANGFANNGNVTALATGGQFTCAVQSGVIYCWGANASGQLGDNSTTPRTTPVLVDGTGGFANNGTVSALSLGGSHTCVVEGTSPNAELYCWGANASGQLGDGTTSMSLVPTRVVPGGGFLNTGTVSALSTGGGHTCALEGGIAYCWGAKLGVSPTESQTTPAKVPDGGGFTNSGLSTLTSGGGAAADGTSCVIKSGTVLCWGANTSGQLGDGTRTPRTGPTPTWSGTPPTTPTAPTSPVVSVGFGHLSVAFTAPSSNGGLPITNYEYSLDGGNTWTTRNPASTASPLVITGLTNGTAYTMQLRAVTDVGAGAALTGITGTPVDEWTNTTASTVEGGGAHTCAVAGGVLYCWGENGDGQLGDGTTTDSTTARRVSPVNGGFTNNGDVSAVALGETHSCAIEDGVLYCWGATVTSPARVTPSADFTNNGTVSAVALGGNQTCVVEAGIVFCSTTPGATPVKVSPSADFTNNGTVSAIAVGGDQVCAIEGGIAVCWSSGAATPVKVTPTNGLANNGTVSAVSLGGAHACVIEGTSPNAVAYCWGDNTSGQLGDGTTTNRTSPVPVVPGGGFQNNGTVTQFSTGLEHTCALAGGIAYCWGSTLGVSPTSAATAPVKVPDGGGFVNGSLTALSSGGGASGGGTSCLIKNGAVSCWGANDAGQLGTGNTTPQSGPSPMLAGTVPGAPSITGVTAGSGQLSVAFTAPGSSGSSAITNYEYSIDGGSTWVTRNPASTVSPLVITGLTNGTSYTVLLRAVNATGPSVASGSSSGTPSAGGGSGGGQGSSGGGSAPSGPLNELISSPATTLAPSAPTPPQGPTVIAPPTAGAEPQLVTEDDAPQVQREPGDAGLVVDGEPVDVEVMSLDIPSARVDPEDRTPAQVAAVQRAGAALLEEFNSLTPEGETPLVTLTNTPTGAVANGVLVDPRNGRTPVPVPVEDLVLVSSPETRVLLAAGTADAKPERVTRGVVTVRPSGVVAALAHGFDPSTPGEVVVFSSPTLLGAFTTDANGTFTGQMTLPPDIEPGEHTLVLTTGTVTTSLGLFIDSDGNAVIEDPTTPGDSPDADNGAIPTPDPGGPTLPATGTGNRVPVLAVAVLMMLLGVVTLRRRPV